ncbi:hypothetical protein EYZ11_003640 [Aspergillus tanneri]|uniref:Uncharacterized protein n=1 Tax=Aspergillus tanneri TaxID=1220188 RepID=A0A4S3JN60_9EURO|nr:hypothetical protein EYZ11_003640 [Aspergillus tanneri]
MGSVTTGFGREFVGVPFYNQVNTAVFVRSPYQYHTGETVVSSSSWRQWNKQYRNPSASHANLTANRANRLHSPQRFSWWDRYS